MKDWFWYFLAAIGVAILVVEIAISIDSKQPHEKPRLSGEVNNGFDYTTIK